MIKKIFKTHNAVYPLMRDPQRNPRCYEMTDQEKLEANRRIEKILEPYFINEAGLKVSSKTGTLIND